MSRYCARWLLLLLAFVSFPAAADHATIAVAANFRATAEAIAEHLGETSSHQYTVISGSTGKLFAQILHGAPYDVFLSADRERPERLKEAGAVTGDVATYAVGRLALWQPGREPESAVAALSRVPPARIVVANPRLAPYGRAAVAFLGDQAEMSLIEPQLVFADSVAGAYAVAATGNAELGLVALATLRSANVSDSEFLVLDRDSHPPIEQGAVVLRRAENNAAARFWSSWLLSPAADALLRQAGYERAATGVTR